MTVVGEDVLISTVVCVFAALDVDRRVFRSEYTYNSSCKPVVSSIAFHPRRAILQCNQFIDQMQHLISNMFASRLIHLVKSSILKTGIGMFKLPKSLCIPMIDA